MKYRIDELGDFDISESCVRFEGYEGNSAMLDKDSNGDYRFRNIKGESPFADMLEMLRGLGKIKVGMATPLLAKVFTDILAAGAKVVNVRREYEHPNEWVIITVTDYVKLQSYNPTRINS